MKLHDENVNTRPRHSRPNFFVVAQPEATHPRSFVLAIFIAFVRDSFPFVRGGLHRSASIVIWNRSESRKWW
jgi:hypothetical protein